MKSGVYCKNVEHVELEDDGMVYCQHCYRELEAENTELRLYTPCELCTTDEFNRLKAENERLRKALENIMDISYPAGVYFIARKALEE